MAFDPPAVPLDPLDDADLIGEWQKWSRIATEAWESAPFDASVHLSYDTVEMKDYLKEQVSDVTITNPRLRRETLAHALLSFLYNTVILAVAINFAIGTLG